MRSKQITFRVTDELLTEIEKRTPEGQSINDIARQMSERYSKLMKEMLSGVEFTENEALCLVDSFNSTMIDYNFARMLWANVADSFQYDKLDEKYDLGDEFVNKLKFLSLAESYAVLDAVERFWAKKDSEATTKEKLKYVGLLK